MRRLYWISFSIILLLVFSSGCLQPANTPPTVTTVVQAPVMTVPVTATTIAEKHLTFTVTKTDKTVTIVYDGGPDAADLLALKIRIDNQDMTNFERYTFDPVVGDNYIFTYMGLANPVTVNIIGTFKGEYQQTVLMYYF